MKSTHDDHFGVNQDAPAAVYHHFFQPPVESRTQTCGGSEVRVGLTAVTCDVLIAVRQTIAQDTGVGVALAQQGVVNTRVRVKGRAEENVVFGAPDLSDRLLDVRALPGGEKPVSKTALGSMGSLFAMYVL